MEVVMEEYITEVQFQTLIEEILEKLKNCQITECKQLLEQIMKEVAQEARESSEKVAKAYFEKMRRNIAEKRVKWAEHINSIINA